MATTPLTPPAQRVFFGELPIAISFMTPTGKPVHFYKGYHVTSDKEVIAFCEELEQVQDVTSKVKVADVPVPEARSRARSWASASRTEITPAELLQRVVSSKDISTAAPSNS